ncbi:hypothetical protein A9Q91_03880 [Candidatus Gracilibacteria bacterium 28_42_T64]|nr:hypothetical protein A9Q91_03880 [Candidatus Gracilibacteria bacterium 28_42_T64]
MSDFKNDLAELVIKQGIVGIKPEGITLKSKKISHWYANCRILSQSMSSLNDVSHLIAGIVTDLVKDQEVDMIMGVPEGATLLSQIINEQLIIAGIIPDKIYQKRAKAKEHGDQANKFWVTGQCPKKIWLFEDVTTSGISTFEYIRKLESEDPEIEIVGVIALINRLQLDKNGVSVVENMEKIGKKYFPLLTVNEVLPNAISLLPESEQEEWKKVINQEYIDEWGENSPVSLG